jgi:uncharacterized membrane protein YgcG
MKRKIIILTIFVSVLLAFTGCMSASHLGHGGGGTSYQSDSHTSHQSGGGSHSGGCH